MNGAGQVGGVSVFFKRNPCAGVAWGFHGPERSATTQFHSRARCRTTTSTSCGRALRVLASRARAERHSPSASTGGKPPTPAKGAECERSTGRSKPCDEPFPPPKSPALPSPARNSRRSRRWGLRCGTSLRCLRRCGIQTRTTMIEALVPVQSAGLRRCARICRNSQPSRRPRRSSPRIPSRPSILSSRNSNTNTISTGLLRDGLVTVQCFGLFRIN